MLINLPFVSGLNLKLGRCAATILALSLSLRGFIAVGNTKVSGADGIEWCFSTDKDGFATITGVKKTGSLEHIGGDGSFLLIPQSLDGKQVRWLGKNCMRGQTWIKRVWVPPGIDVSLCAFMGCSGLKEAKVFGHVGPGAFRDCVGLESVVVSGNVGQLAFKGCAGLKKAEIYGDIGIYAFSECDNLEMVVIRHGVHNIRDGALAGCKRLKVLALPESLCFLGNRAFIGCQALESMTIPRNIQEIGDGLFSGCDSLKSVEITGNVTNVGSRAFFNCGMLESICLPDTVTRLGEEAFLNCSSLRSVKLSRGMTDIGASAFRNCGLLQKIYIPASVTNIDFSAFGLCAGIRNVNVDPSNPSFVFRDGLLMTRDERVLLAAFGDRERLNVPDGVAEIRPRAFSACPNLVMVRIPSSVARANGMLRECRSLNEIRVADGNDVYSAVGGILLSSDGKTLLGGVDGIMDLVVPETVSAIAPFAFQGSPILTSVTITGNLHRIGDYAFSLCRNLKDVRLGKTLCEIGDDAFSSCEGIKKVVIPATVTKIGRGAFYGCSSLVEVSFLGNKPECDWDGEIYALTSDSLVTVILASSIGWGMDADGAIPKTWQGRTLRYADNSSAIYPTIWDIKGFGK